MVGRHHAGLAVALELGAVDEIEHRPAGAEIENQAPPRAFDLLVLEAAGPAQDRRHHGERRQRLRQSRGDEHRLAVSLQSLLGERHQRDHPLIGLAGALAEGEDAVLVQDQPFHAGLRVVHVGRRLGEREARHDVGHGAGAAAIDLRADGFAVRLVDQAQNRAGVGVVDEFVRQEGVQQDLDRRVRRRRIEQVLALDAHHLLVGERVAGAQLAQAIEPHRRQPGGLDRRHVGARALDAERLDLLAEEIGHRRLHRGVAAAVQHQLGIAAEKTRGVDAQCKVAADAVAGVAVDDRLRILVDPAAFHPSSMPFSGLTPCRARACSTSRSGAGDRCPRSRSGRRRPAAAARPDARWRERPLRR